MVSPAEMTTSALNTAREAPREVANAVDVATVAVEVLVEAERVASPSSMPETRKTSPPYEAEAPAHAETKVNFKSLDYSHAFRCDE